MVPEKAVRLAKLFEGLYLVAYRDPVGVWTVGWGHTGGVVAGQTITLAQAEGLLNDDMWDAMVSAIQCCPILLLHFDRLAAISDWTFNLGETRLKASTLRRKINARDWEAAKVEIQKWVFAKGRKLPGLVLRRRAEALLF